MTKFEVWKIVVSNNKRDAVLFSVEKDLKSAYDLVCGLSEFVKDIKLVISELDETNESNVGTIVEFYTNGYVKLVVYNIEQVKE